MKKNDMYLLISVIALAFMIWIIQQSVMHAEGGVVTVTQDGICIGTYSLEEDKVLSFTDEKGGTNVLTIRDQEAYMSEADCPDKLCVKQKAISRKGESIICLPHRLVIEVTEGEENVVDAVVG